MPSQISVIIPTLNSAHIIAPTLLCVWEGMKAGLIGEVIIADGGSSDHISKIAKELGATFMTITPPSRGQQLIYGAKKARGKWLLFLHADTIFSKGWIDIFDQHINTSDNAAYARLRFDDTKIIARLIAYAANWRSRFFGLPYGDQGLLIKRSLFDEIGGYPDIPLMEDVAIVRKLKGQLSMLNTHAITSAEKYQKQGWIKRSSKNLFLLLRYLWGASPDHLAHIYRKK